MVISKAGRDKGYFMAVVGIDREKDFVIVADGKERPLERPKRKNPKHLQKTNYTIDLEQLTDKKLRRFLGGLSQQKPFGGESDVETSIWK